MPLHTDNLESAMRYALLTTRAIAVCPFHPEVMIRVGDGDAETHAYYRARSITKSDGTCWEREDLMQEIVRQQREGLTARLGCGQGRQDGGCRGGPQLTLCANASAPALLLSEFQY
jgi:hypothetical protein